MSVELGRVVKVGRALYVTLPAKTLREFSVNIGDRIAVRVAGDRLVLERVKLELLAKLGQSEAHV